MLEALTVPRVHFGMRDEIQHAIDTKTKPPGSLGRIESLAMQMALVQGTLTPKADPGHLMIFAGDHGIVEEGVSAFPAKVTLQMVENFLDGGAAINCFCQQFGIDLKVVDMGVNGDLANHPLLINHKVGYGTANFSIQEAMSHEETIRAIECGINTFLDEQAQQSCKVVGMGEMGIGNTSSASAIISAATSLPVDQVVGRGTGVDNKGIERKREVIQRALDLHRPSPNDGIALLRMLGGFELAGMCGAVLAAASENCCVVLDGLISTAAGLTAYLICPEIKDYLVAGHKSVEVGQQAALNLMGLEPVIDLDMRLGEGTGAAITINLIELACKMMRDMASFEKAGVDGSLA